MTQAKSLVIFHKKSMTRSKTRINIADAFGTALANLSRLLAEEFIQFVAEPNVQLW